VSRGVSLDAASPSPASAIEPVWSGAFLSGFSSCSFFSLMIW
jgi:hypothetical protein